MSDAKLFKLRQRLLCRIGRRYHVVTEPLQITGLRFPFTRIVDPDRVLDEVAAEADLRDRLGGVQAAPGDELHLPYWAEVWESGRGIGEFLVSAECRVGVSAECRVQGEELKAGGCNDLPSADPSADSLSPQHSARCVSPLSPQYSDLSGSLLSTQHSALSTSSPLCTSSHSVLDLGCGMGMAGSVAAALGANVVFADFEAPALLFARLNSMPWRRRVRTRRLNWQRDRLDQKFDLILGADILYERAQWPFLETFWRCHLAQGGRVILGEPGRQTGDLFIAWINAQGWKLVQTEIPVATRPRPVRIFDVTI